MSADEAPRPRPARRRVGVGLRLASFAAVALALVAGAVQLYMAGGRYVSTENAYIKAEKIAVSTDVSGRVAEVWVAENQEVEPGQLLFRLDEETFRIALRKAEAELAGAVQRVEALRAVYRQKIAELRIAEEDVEYYRTTFERSRTLNERGVVSQARFEEERLKLGTARQREVALRQDIARVLAGLNGDPDLPVENHPEVLTASAIRDQEALDLRRARIASPARAIVTNLNLEAGEYVEAGKPVFSLVTADSVWVEANLKETELTHVRVGQPARVQVDAYPGLTWLAVVTGISPATGAEFSLLPPQNASGNWVKVVQRLPVRLEIRTGPAEQRLRAGMSADVEIDTGRERVLPGVVASALAWVRNSR